MLQARSSLAWRLGEKEQALELRRAALAFAHDRHGEEGMEAATSRLALAETLLWLGHAAPALEQLQRAEPVSYTHLDVYKRQSINCPGP